MRIVQFNGLGKPMTDGVNDGDVLILLQGDQVTVVKLSILHPDEYGPSLTPADNQAELADEARAVVASHYPELLESDRHWTFECPLHIAERATFMSSDDIDGP